MEKKFFLEWGNNNKHWSEVLQECTANPFITVLGVHVMSENNLPYLQLSYFQFDITAICSGTDTFIPSVSKWNSQILLCDPFQEALGFELWSMSENIYFDNILVTSDPATALAWAEDTWKLKQWTAVTTEVCWMEDKWMPYINNFLWNCYLLEAFLMYDVCIHCVTFIILYHNHKR